MAVLNPLTDNEIEQAYWLVVWLRAQVETLDSEASITKETFETMDNKLHDLQDFIQKAKQSVEK